MQTRRIPVADGLTVEADFKGPSSGPGVILMHGGGQTRHAWGQTTDALARRGYATMAFDARGHGGSDWSAAGRYGVEPMMDDLRIILTQSPPRPVLIGASMGGGVALCVAAADADAASALVLVDVTPRVDLAGAEQIIGFMRAHRDGFASLEEAADAVAAYLPHRPRPKDNGGLMKNLRLRDDGRLYWHWDPGMVRDGPMDREAHGIFLEEQARRITVPTLLVRGGKSELVKPEHARQFQALVPGSEWVDVADARHMVAGDSNSQFTDAILDFLGRVCPVSSVASA
jgi:pimeloyl-ACP methyl ester carboxylesterase